MLGLLNAKKLLRPSLALGWVVSCAVFPDEAVLPSSTAAGAPGAAGEGGTVIPSVGGDGGTSSATVIAGEPGFGGGGAASVPVVGGTPGGGAPGCADERQVVRLAAGDAWIDANATGARHGGDDVLYVAAGLEERRALIQFALPATPSGAIVLRGTLSLQLESNADVSLAERHLELSQLAHEFNEGRTSWDNFTNGANGQWQVPGGDFGPPLASATIPAMTVGGTLTFDVTAVVAEALATTIVPLPLIVVEVGAPPTPPAELAFTSREGDASGVPELLIEYCP